MARLDRQGGGGGRIQPAGEQGDGEWRGRGGRDGAGSSKVPPLWKRPQKPEDAIVIG
ncbi:hypothetical protein [Synechococcus sp. CS-1332]|uniref:hypothetical protein n=1 Tax=Synechococcus sp. CS-1332 TaxID=2847972 RepID=UPI00223A69D3|nr:hypothetical protein [Synechococcus sp. CS-1332]